MVYKNCEYCGKGFETARFHSNQKFCNVKCKRKVHYKKFIKRNPTYQKSYFKRYWDKYYKENKKKFRDKIKIPEMIKAQNELNNAINYGRINVILESCQICGSKEDLIKHHPDYSKPFEFIVLCRGCHTKIHHNHTDLKNVIKHYEENGI